MTPNEKTDGLGPDSDEPLELEAPALPASAPAADPAASRTVLDRGPTRPLPESALDANETVDARFGDALDGHRTMDATLDASFDPSHDHTHDGGLQAEDRAALLAMRRALEVVAPPVRIVDPDPAPSATVIDPVLIVESAGAEDVAVGEKPEDGPEDAEPDEVGHGPAVVGVLPAVISTAPPDVGDKAESVHSEPDRGAGDLRGDDTFDQDRKVTAALRGLVDKKGLQDTLDRGRHQLGITQDEDGLLDVLSSLEAALGGNSIVDNPFDDVGPTAGGSPAESPKPALHSADPLDDVLSPKTPLPGSAVVLSAGVVPAAIPAAAPPALPTPAPKPAVAAPASAALPDPDELQLPASKAAPLELSPVAVEVGAPRTPGAHARPRSALELQFEDDDGAMTSSVLDDLGALQASAAAPPLSSRTPSMPTPILGAGPGPNTPALAPGPPAGAAPVVPPRAVSAPRASRRSSAEHPEATSSRPERRAVAPTRKGPGLWLGLALLLIVLSIVLVAMSARR
jgi:hypothetical protein